MYIYVDPIKSYKPLKLALFVAKNRTSNHGPLYVKKSSFDHLKYKYYIEVYQKWAKPHKQTGGLANYQIEVEVGR